MSRTEISSGERMALIKFTNGLLNEIENLRKQTDHEGLNDSFNDVTFKFKQVKDFVDSLGK